MILSNLLPNLLSTNPEMSVIAVAGGTDGIGRAVTEAIVAQGLFKVIVLTRKVS